MSKHDVNLNTFTTDRTNYLENNRTENFELIDNMTKLKLKVKLLTIFTWILIPLFPFNLLLLIPRYFAKLKLDNLGQKLNYNTINKNSTI